MWKILLMVVPLSTGEPAYFASDFGFQTQAECEDALPGEVEQADILFKGQNFGPFRLFARCDMLPGKDI